MNGFAVKNARGEILINTVSDTERAAMVNWLVTVAKVMIYPDHSDEFIANSFGYRAFSERATLVPVEVREGLKQ